MSSSADHLLDELMKLLNYDKLNGRQLKVKLFESSLKIKTLSEELEETKLAQRSSTRGLEHLKEELDNVRQELHDTEDQVDMLEGVLDAKQKIIDEKGYTPSILVKRYNTTKLIEDNSPYCGGVAYTESGIISLEVKLESAKKDFEELEIENKNLLDKIQSLEVEIEILENQPSDYQVQQDFRIKELILSGEGLEKDFDSLTQYSKHQKDQLDEKVEIISQLHREVGVLKEIIHQKDGIIRDHKEIISQKDEVIEASGVSLTAKDLEIGELMTVIAEGEAVNFSDVARDLQVEIVEKDLEIEKLKNSLDDKNDIIDYYFSST